MSRLISFLVIVATAIAAIEADKIADLDDRCNAIRNAQELPLFDIYKLTLNSVGGYCVDHKCDKVPKGQAFPYPALTIGSLETIKRNSVEVTNCISVEFDPEQAKKDTKNLTVAWPSLDPAVSQETLWTQQVKRYGSCAYCCDRKLANAADFLRLGVITYNSDVFGHFASEGITPSVEQPIELSKFKKALRKGMLDGKVQFNCKGTRDGSDILQGLSVCMDMDLGYVFCPVTQNTDCHTEKVWFYGNLSSAEKSAASTAAVIAASLVTLFVSRMS